MLSKIFGSIRPPDSLLAIQNSKTLSPRSFDQPTNGMMPPRDSKRKHHDYKEKRPNVARDSNACDRGHLRNGAWG